MRRLRDVTFGQAADTVLKYRPFIVTVLAVLLIVLLLPGRGSQSSVATGGSALATVNPSGSAALQPGGATTRGAAGTAVTGTGANAVATGAAATAGGTGGGGGPGGVTAATAATAATTNGTTAPYSIGPEVVPAGRYGAASVGTAAALGSANCDRTRGTILLPTIYAPPCVAPFPKGASNGGATAQGVTASTIKILLYLPANGPETAALESVGLTEPASQQEAQVNGVVQELEHHVELYGRKIQIVDYTSSVADTGSAAVAEARADAIQVATQVKPFLAIGIGPVSNYFDLDVAQRGVIDFSQYNWDDSTLQQTAPYMYALYDNDHIFAALASYIGKRLAGHKAQYGGALVAPMTRKFGVIYGTSTFTTADIARFNADLAQDGVRINPADEVGIDDSTPTGAAQQSQTAVTKLQTDGVTSVIPLSGLFGLVAMGPAATKQGYFPEWIVNPIGYADADQVAQLMDPAQWQHAFGMTSVYPQVMPLSADQNGVGLWEWQYHSAPPGTQTYAGLAMSDFLKIFTGLEMAGPDLTPLTYRAGLFDAPPRGGAFVGGAATDAVDYGSHGIWSTPNYASIDDFTQIYWSGKTTCYSQSGQSQNGCYLYINDARRYLWNQFPSGAPALFQYLPTDITNIQGGDPPNERAPEYPEHDFY